MVSTQQHAYGYIKDAVDSRDFRAMVAAPDTLVHLPALVDLRPNFQPVRNQGNLGSCTAFATTSIVEFIRRRQGLPDIEPSELYQYYMTRGIEGTINQDSGGQLRDAMKAAATYGSANELDWPYDVTKFTTKPPDSVTAGAIQHKALVYSSVAQNLDQLRASLALGFPFFFGFNVYESFESALVASNGLMPMPKPGERILGGHATVAVGYDDAKQTFIMRNSWGPSWGDKGYYYMPYAFMVDFNQCSDFWRIETVSDND